MLPFDVHWPSFWFGFGLVVVLGFVVFLVNWFGQYLGTPFKPQMVVQTTKKTPWQVVMGCASSWLLIAGVGLLIAVGITVLFMNAQLPEVTWMIAIAVVSFIAGVLTRVLMA